MAPSSSLSTSSSSSLSSSSSFASSFLSSRIPSSVYLMCISAFEGGCDSLRLPSTIVFFLASPTLRLRTSQCFILNGVIFLGSIFIAEYLVGPLVRAAIMMAWTSTASVTVTDDADMSMINGTMQSLSSSSSSIASSTSSSLMNSEFMLVFFHYIYQLLWIYPIYAISFILNAIWYADIAEHAFITHGGSSSQSVPLSFAKWVNMMSDEVYRLLLVTSFGLQMTLVSLIPYIGTPLVFIHLCWLYSLYSFEYKWSLEMWSLEYRLQYFERHWCYFLGFGMPAATLSVAFPRFVSGGVFAMAFPVFIILAIIARPRNHGERREKRVKDTNDRDGKQRDDNRDVSARRSSSSTSTPIFLAQLPIFRMATAMNWCVLRRLNSMKQRKTMKQGTTTTTSDASSSARTDDTSVKKYTYAN